jgi:hypothetical protein
MTTFAASLHVNSGSASCPLRVICRHHPVSRERPLSAISGHGDGWGIDPLTRYEYDEWRVPLM